MKNNTSAARLLSLGIVLAVFTISIVVAFSGTTIAQAKGIFGLGKKTASATSTLAYMTAGTATTTLTYDTYTDGITTADSMALLVQLTASSSPNTVLAIRQEFSQDGIDWYQNSQPTILENSTTTVAVDVGTVPSYQWRFASSTMTIGGVTASSNRDTRMIPINSPTRFVRFVFTIPAGAANGALWAQILPVKQNP